MPDIYDTSPEQYTPDLEHIVHPLDELTEHHAVARKLGELSLDNDTPLRDHQIDAFEDIVSFYAEGGRECYVTLPTGSGKTVLFVEICKQLIQEAKVDGQTPRIIVHEPTKDLVDQTVGSVNPETQKLRGFMGFAPELDVRPIHSDLSEAERFKNLIEAQVVVTTYNTFRNLSAQLSKASTKSSEEWASVYERNLITADEYDQRAATMRSTRSEFLHKQYNEQEVERLRSDISQLQDAIGSSQISATEAEIKYLNDLSGITNISGRANDEILKNAVAYMRYNFTDRMKDGIEAIYRSVEMARETVRNKYPTNNNEQRVVAIKPKLSTREKSLAAEEGLRLADLSETEQMLTSFVYRHRGSKHITRSDLRRPQDARQYSEYSDEIFIATGRASSLRTENKYIAWMRDIGQIASNFELIICDEAHRVVGKNTWQAMREYAQDKDIAVLGLTATDVLAERSLEDYFEQKAHELTKQEAIKREIVNPMSLFVYDTGMRFNEVSLDASGEYDVVSFREMRFSNERNTLGVRLISELIQLGYQGITPCIAGDNGQHAKLICQMINESTIIDPRTGERREAIARYVLDSTPKHKRDAYYHAYERGDVDWLTYIDVLGEGWDSDAAKAMVALRPTRSPLIATQRLGRIGRTHPGAQISVAIDLFDGIVSGEGKSEIPPVLALDVFEARAGKQGLVIGDQSKLSQSVLDSLRSLMPTDTITPHYTKYKQILKDMPVVNASGVTTSVGMEKSLGNPRNWQTWQALAKRYHGYLPHDALNLSPNIRRTMGRKGAYIVELLNIPDATQFLDSRQIVNPWKLLLDGDTKWISAEGCTMMLSKVLPGITEEQIEDALLGYENETGQVFDKQLARKPLTFTNANRQEFGIIYMYKLEQITERVIPIIVSQNKHRS
jgi:superfamily II DNA or RNA helicase